MQDAGWEMKIKITTAEGNTWSWVFSRVARECIQDQVTIKVFGMHNKPRINQSHAHLTHTCPSSLIAPMQKSQNQRLQRNARPSIKSQRRHARPHSPTQASPTRSPDPPSIPTPSSATRHAPRGDPRHEHLPTARHSTYIDGPAARAGGAHT